MEKTAFRAATRYVERKGYEILETCPPFIGAADNGVFIMIGVTHFAEGEFTDDPAPCREDYERAMIKMALAGGVPTDVPIRLDHVSIRIVSEEAAILRHHIGLDLVWRELEDGGTEAGV